MAKRQVQRTKRSGVSKPAGKTTRTISRSTGRTTAAGQNKNAAPTRHLDLAALRNRRRKDRESLRLRALEPSLTVSDIERSLRFYTDVLGFYVSERWTEKGVLLGVNLKAGTCELGLAQDDWAKGRDRQKGAGIRIWCRTAQDVDEMAEQIKAAGGELTEEPVDQSWGVRSFAIDDPDGYHFTIYREQSEK
jgi:lactoylglutathione lyase